VLKVLTEEQRAVLEGYRQGLTHQEIAGLVGRSRPTVTRTIARIWELSK